MSFGVTDLIREQSFDCIIMFCCGLAMMMFYQLCSFLSRLIHLGKWIRVVLELAFWTVGAVLVSEFLYYCAYGEITLHSAGAFAAGLLLWKLFFYDIMRPNTLKGKRIKGLNIHGKEKKKPRV